MSHKKRAALRENAKKNAKAKENDKEAKEKEAAEKEKAEAKQKDKEADESAGDDEGDDHADVDQDKELIKKMIAEYLGDDAGKMSAEESGAMERLATEAYEGFKQMGYSEDEAKQAAGHAIKLAKHMASKENKETKEGCDDEKADAKADAKKDDKSSEESTEAKEGDDAKESGDDDEKECDKSESKESSSKKVKELEAKLKESNDKLIKVQGELAGLKGKSAKTEVEKYVDSKLAESKLPHSVTKAFREAAGELKSKKEFDDKWNLFSVGIANVQGELDFGDVLTEKAKVTESGTSGEGGLDFSECAKN